jgi:hypothetical protein
MNSLIDLASVGLIGQKGERCRTLPRRWPIELLLDSWTQQLSD